METVPPDLGEPLGFCWLVPNPVLLLASTSGVPSVEAPAGEGQE